VTRVGREISDHLSLLIHAISDPIHHVIMSSGIDSLLRMLQKWSGKTCCNLDFLDRKKLGE
jgi:hypothetical protein